MKIRHYHLIAMIAALFLGTACSDMEEAINERIVSTQTEEETPQEETANKQQTKAGYVYSNVITIELQEEGTLDQVLTLSSLNADKLVISGKIDASDFAIIKSMSNLLSLDMTDVTFVQNSTTYKSNGYSYSLKEGIINEYMFYGWKNITEIKLPKSIQEIGEFAFNDCIKLNTIEIPKGIRQLKQRTFDGCLALSSVILPDSLKTIGSYAFKSTAIKNLDFLPDSLQSLGEGAFAGSSLTSAKLPRLNGIIPNNLFGSCLSLASVTLPENIHTINEGAFYFCPSLKSIELPDNLKKLGEGAFRESGLQTIEIPAQITTINNSTFRDCTSLQTVKLPEGVTEIGEYAFDKCYAMTLNAQLPEGITSIGAHAFHNCDALTELVFPSTLTTVPKYCCCDCDNLASVTLSEGTSGIDSNAFDLCWKLTENGIHLPGSLTWIGEYSFASTGITTIDFLPEGLKSIYGYAFYNSTLKNGVLKFPSTVTYLADNALYGGKNTTAIYLPSKESIAVGDIFGFNKNYIYGKTNCLIYTNSESCNSNYVKNVVANGVCLSLQLVETASFNCPEAFAAAKVTFVKQFNQTGRYYPDTYYLNSFYAPKGEASHWYGLSLPFEVTEISTSDGRKFAPFNAGVEDAKPFWLRRMTADGSWENMTEIEAGEPYIIAFPCSESYDSQFNVWGEVTFTGKNVQIPVTEEYGINGGFYSMKRNYAVLSQSAKRLLLNSPRWGYYGPDWYNNNYDYNRPHGRRGNDSYNWGSRFIANLRPSWAFEAYIGVGTATTTSLSIGSESNTRSSKTLGSVPSIDDM